MNPICKIWGHKFDQDMNFHGPWECDRCDYVFDQYDEGDCESKSFNLGGKCFMLKQRVADYIWRKTRWLFKCHDCGKRFNKHTKDCAPF